MQGDEFLGDVDLAAQRPRSMERLQESRDFSTRPGTFRLSDHAGHPVVLYFYPKDNTPGCTTEGAQFRDLHAKFRKAGAVVAGVSRDSLKSHESFSDKMEFPFRAHRPTPTKRCASSST